MLHKLVGFKPRRHYPHQPHFIGKKDRRIVGCDLSVKFCPAVIHNKQIIHHCLCGAVAVN